MHPIRTYNVTPRIPKALKPLHKIAFNLWWTWQPDARRLFWLMDPVLWDQTNHSPVRMLQLTKQGRLQELAGDDDFIREMKAVEGRFDAYMAAKDTYGLTRKAPKGKAIVSKETGPVAYFSAEFGFHESFPNYSGGLGILSGDHCKAASDLGLPFCAFTLLYRHGYFRQQIGRDGWQESVQLNQNFSHLPLIEARDTSGHPAYVDVEIIGRRVRAKIWRLEVGRITLFLLDTDIPENTEEDRLITAQLYGGDNEMRIKQEIVLGIGGVHALNVLGIKPAVFHMNEGHSAFLTLELVRRQVQENGLSFYAALQLVAAGNVFTTHTPVPAGNDAFPLGLMEKYFSHYPAQVGIDFSTFCSFGQTRKDPTEPFSMTILALRSSRHANGVSELHGFVSQGLWKDVWAGVPEHEVPITSVTNGIHTRTWMAPEFAALYDKYLPDWEKRLIDVEYWRGVYDIPDEELWRTHQALKRRLVEFVRKRVSSRYHRLGEAPERIRSVGGMLNPEVLTIGFARRFATYKRATLLFKDPERLLKLLGNPERPVQFVFAGKAHPKDEPGKSFIQEVYRYTRMPEFENRIVFIEDYDTYVGRRMYQGVDLWLNNPLRPLEASGTSGMKLPPNGGLNLSVLDGWWCEAYRTNRKAGWAIGADISDGSPEFQNEVDVASLFHVLETQVVPLFYAKPDGQLPLAWLQLMRESIRSITPVYNTERMVREYAERLYDSAAAAHIRLGASGGKAAAALADWKDKMRAHWGDVRVERVETGVDGVEVQVGDQLAVSAIVKLGRVEPGDVEVQAYFGEELNGHIASPNSVRLERSEEAGRQGAYVYKGAVPATESGSYGLNVRVIPTHPDLVQAHELRLIAWGA